MCVASYRDKLCPFIVLKVTSCCVYIFGVVCTSRLAIAILRKDAY